ncbi:MAG: glutaredoxin-like protein NrdH [Streptococcaceae bacterium]|jgi:glutaredoxin-like protein NrdH|nr:glutaredoxin-like protein NrdH [Streptococcaceae bacterium]
MQEIKVFSKINCMQCKMVKRFLDDKNIDYLEINVEEQPEMIDYVKSLGFQTLPVVETTNKVFSGFRPNELKELLA